MNGSLATLLLLVIPSVVVLVSLAVPRAPLPTGSERLGRVEQATRLWRVTGLSAGAVAAAGAISWGGVGRGPMLAGPLVALGLLAGVLVGEVRVVAPGGPERRAALEVRRVRDVLTRGLTGGAVACVGYLLILLTVTTAMASADDLGRAGRALAIQCSPVLQEVRGPWPGSFYSVPLAALVLGGLIAAAIALDRIVQRPRQGEDVTTDDALRRDAARAVVAAVGLLAVVPLGGVIPVTAIALLGTDCAPVAWTVGAGVILASLPVLMGLGVWFLTVLVRTSRSRAPRPLRGGVVAQ